MSIEYELSLSKLTTPPSYAPLVRPQTTVDLPTLAASSTVAPGNVQADIVEQIEAAFLAGNWVSLSGIGILTTSLKGQHSAAWSRGLQSTGCLAPVCGVQCSPRHSRGASLPAATTFSRPSTYLYG